MKKQTYYLIGSKGGTSRWIYITFFCIIAFSLIFFPFYAVNLRYQLGYIFRQILDGIGWISLTLGSLLTAISILSLFTGGRSMRSSTLIIGIVLLWIGCWVTGSVFNLFGITIGNERASGGYH
ncbi:MAG: hypothetical protein KJI71_04140 [Patescibacteria group bacterium]|nr:hypothetical protein [Patescibacteria group bacterium]